MTFAKLARLSKGILIQDFVKDCGFCSRKRYQKFETRRAKFNEAELGIACHFLGIDEKMALKEVRITKSSVSLEDYREPIALRRIQSGKGCAAGASSHG